MVATGSNIRRGILEAARQNIVLPHELDVSARLASHNLMYGLGRILAILSRIDPRASARFYASPDLTITRSPLRWGSGFAYGGVLEITDCSVPVVFPELRPNTCGASLSLVEKEFSASEFVKRVVDIRFATNAAIWDYGRRNHFVNLYRSAESGRQIVAVHGCPMANKVDTKDGPGLFFDQSDYWRSRVEKISTPLGPFAILRGEDATAFWHNYRRCEEVSKRERLAMARRIGGEGTVLVNETHEGMHSPWLYVKGCQIATDPDGVFPVFTDIGSRAYLVSAVTPERGRSVALPAGVTAILPHGTGYNLPLPDAPLETIEAGNRSTYLIRRDSGLVEAYADFAHIPYGYRPSRIVRSWEAEGRLRIVDELEPVAFTKL